MLWSVIQAGLICAPTAVVAYAHGFWAFAVLFPAVVLAYQLRRFVHRRLFTPWAKTLSAQRDTRKAGLKAAQRLEKYM